MSIRVTVALRKTVVICGLSSKWMLL